MIKFWPFLAPFSPILPKSEILTKSFSFITFLFFKIFEHMIYHYKDILKLHILIFHDSPQKWALKGPKKAGFLQIFA